MAPVNPNANEYRSVIGLDNVYIAEVTQDDASGYVADTPEYLAPVAEATHKPSVSTETQYADNQAFDVISSQGETVIEVDMTAIPPEMLAKITGEEFDAATGRVFDSGNAEPPFIAVMFRALKSGGGYRYYSYLKCRAEMPGEEASSKADKANIKRTKLTLRSVGTVYQFGKGKSFKRVFGDTDTTNFSATGWYSQVQTPTTTTPSALSLSSSSPADGATGVVVSVSPTLTFNNALVNEAVNMVVLTKADGTQAAAAVSLDTAKKVITVNPTVDMDASTVYLLTYAVKDIYGQTLSGVINFTTA